MRRVLDRSLDRCIVIMNPFVDHAATPATARYVIVTDAIVTCFNVGSAIHEDADNSRTYKESSVELQLRKRNIHMMRGVKTRGMSGGQNSMRDKIGY